MLVWSDRGTKQGTRSPIELLWTAKKVQQCLKKMLQKLWGYTSTEEKKREEVEEREE